MTSVCNSSCSCAKCARKLPISGRRTAARQPACRRDRDVGAVRLSRIEAAMRETRAARAGNRRVLVLGLGQAECRWRVGDGRAARVRVADSRAAPPHGRTIARRAHRRRTAPREHFAPKVSPMQS